MVPLAEIEANDFNLNLPRYIDSTEPEDLQDIDAHLRGGIPNRDMDALDRYWQVFPSVRATLFEPADRPGYSRLKVAAGDIKAAIFGHAEFTAFNQSVTALFEKWQTANTPDSQRHRHGRQAQGADRNAVREPAGDLQGRPAARSLRRLPAPDGLLGPRPCRTMSTCWCRKAGRPWWTASPTPT